MQAGLEESTRANLPADDLALVHASKKGDVTAFGELVKRYDRKLLRIAQNVIQNQEDAEDAVQEAFLKAYRKLDQFQEQAKFSTWLVRITLHESFMKLRKQRGRMECSIDDNQADSIGARLPVEVPDWTPGPEELFSQAELREILIKCLGKLSPALKAVFVLRDMEECSLTETAQILDLTPTAVKTRASRARLQLREELSKYFNSA